MIFWVPTPLAMPAHLVSTSRIMLHRSAHAWLIIVIWAPAQQVSNIKGAMDTEWSNPAGHRPDPKILDQQTLYLVESRPNPDPWSVGFRVKFLLT